MLFKKEIKNFILVIISVKNKYISKGLCMNKFIVARALETTAFALVFIICKWGITFNLYDIVYNGMVAK